MLTIEIRRAGFNVLTVTCARGTSIKALLQNNQVAFEGSSIRFNGEDVTADYSLNTNGEIRVLKMVKGN